jgi:chromosome partitioning protein
MAMRVIVVSSRKGGAGKTTVSGHLAVAAEAAGEGPVALIDTDEQGNLAQWWNAREADVPLFTQCAIKDLKTHLKAMEEQGVKLVIIDTPPGMNTESRLVLEKILPCADLVLVPTRPSPHDLRAIGATVELVEQAKKRMVFVVNGAANRAKITGDAAIALSQYGTVAPVTLFQRTDFAASMTDGRTVQEIDPNGKSAQEVADLWKYVSAQLRK